MTKSQQYEQVLQRLRSLTAGEADAIAVMATTWIGGVKALRHAPPQ